MIAQLSSAGSRRERIKAFLEVVRHTERYLRHEAESLRLSNPEVYVDIMWGADQLRKVYHPSDADPVLSALDDYVIVKARVGAGVEYRVVSTLTESVVYASPSWLDSRAEWGIRTGRDIAGLIAPHIVESRGNQ